MSTIAGILRDGFKTLVTIGTECGVDLYEKEVTPPSMEGGGPIDTTTMRNSAWRTRSPKSLKTLGQSSFTAAYDPVCYTELLTLLQENVQITVTFPDAGTLVFWGWLDSFKPAALKEGEQPTAECTIEPSNTNGSYAETAPVFSGASLESLKRLRMAKKKFIELSNRIAKPTAVDIKKVEDSKA